MDGDSNKTRKPADEEEEEKEEEEEEEEEEVCDETQRLVVEKVAASESASTGASIKPLLVLLAMVVAFFSALTVLVINKFLGPCEPRGVALLDDDNEFHRQIAEAQAGHRLVPPLFHGVQHELCSNGSKGMKWSYCLPIVARKDSELCTRADRTDLLRPNASTELCHAAVLHLLLVEVYETLQRFDRRPALLFGTLLGAVRNQSLIPFTEDADVGYLDIPSQSLEEVADQLATRGFHMFLSVIWRVCVAPTHPLAGVLYASQYNGLVKRNDAPYLDLYGFRPQTNISAWRVDKIRGGRPIPNDRFEPFSQVRLNDREFDTVADPGDFLLREYGDDYMTPKPRGQDKTKSFLLD